MTEGQGGGCVGAEETSLYNDCNQEVLMYSKADSESILPGCRDSQEPLQARRALDDGGATRRPSCRRT